MRNADVLVSIVVPVYNVAPFVAKTLGSLLSQVDIDPELVEILVIDDVSTDDSMNRALAALSGSDSKIRRRVHEHSQNLGLAAARNSGVHQSRGEFIWFVDADDYVDPSMLSVMIKALGEDVDVVVTDVLRVDEDGSRPLARVDRGEDAVWSGLEAVDELFSRRIDAFMCNKLIRRTLFDGLTFPVGRGYEDIAIMGSILARARKVAYLDSCLYFYVRRGGAITANFSTRSEDLVLNIDEGIQQVEKYKPAFGATNLALVYRYRSGIIPVFNAAAVADKVSSDERSMLDRVRRRIVCRDIIKLARLGESDVACVALLLRLRPKWYWILYRRLIIPRRRRRLDAIGPRGTDGVTRPSD